MHPVIYAEQMRQIDRATIEEYQTSSLLLMEAAADECFKAITEYCSEDLSGKRARILCGPGNNGGDGAALGRAFSRAGLITDIILFGKVEDSKGDARANFEIVRSLAKFEATPPTGPSLINFIECESLSRWEEIALVRRSYDFIVDALFGTGLRRPLEGIYVQVVQHLEMLKKARDRGGNRLPLIVSIDLPSGLNADLPEPIGETVQADLTITLTAPKPANVLPPASFFGGHLVVGNIGSPKALVEAHASDLFVIESCDARKWLVQTRYTPNTHKNSHGHALIIAGSRNYTGAAVLSGNAAMRSGAGLVTVATAASAQGPIAASAMPELITTGLPENSAGAISEAAVDRVQQLASKMTVLALGPGLTAEDPTTRSFVRQTVQTRTIPMIIDADGLNCLSPWPDDLRGSEHLPLVLTPHPGEMLRLLGESDKSVLANRIGVAREFATRHQVILVLKGSRCLVAAPNGRVFANPTGNAGLGTAGSGDTLTGVITGFLAQTFATLGPSADALGATLAAVYISGLAGDLAAQKLGMRAMVASDVREHLGTAIRLLDKEGESP